MLNKVMCKTCETLFPLAVVVGIIALVAVLSAQTRTAPTFTISTVAATCLSMIVNPLTGEVTSPEIQIMAEGKSIVITSSIRTPNPCYSAAGDVKINGRDIHVDLTAVPNQEHCIQCIGEISGKVVIQNLTKGWYGVDVRTPGSVAITTIMIE